MFWIVLAAGIAYAIMCIVEDHRERKEVNICITSDGTKALDELNEEMIKKYGEKSWNKSLDKAIRVLEKHEK